MQRIVSGEGICDPSKHILSSNQENKEAETNLLRNNSEKTKATMSHSPSVLLDANLVENDGDDGDLIMQIDPSLSLESRLPVPPLDPQFQKEEVRNISKRRDPGSSPVSIPSNNGDSTRSDKKKCSSTTMTGQQQRQTPLSIISGLFPNVGLLPLARNDSRNSGTTTSLGSGLQRSQNSSRDWGWFEDVHHSDQSVNGPSTSGGDTIGSTRIGANNNNERKNTGGSITSSYETRTSLPQHKLTSRADNAMYGNGISKNNNKIGTTSIGGPNLRTTNKLDNNNQHGTNERGEDNASDSKNNRNDRLRARSSGGTNIKTTSLLPTGDEMLIDEMQEYLEPIVIIPRPRDMENEAAIQAVTAPNYVLEESLSDQLLWKKTAGNRPPQPVEERAFFEAQWAENFAMSEVEYRMPAEVLTATTPASLNPFADGNFATDGTGVIGGGGTPVADVGGARIGGGNHHVVADIVSSFVVPGGTGGLGVSSGQQNPHHNSRHRVVRSTSGSGGDLIVFAKGDNVFGTTVSKSFARPSINGELVSGVDTVNISIASYRVVESEKRGKHAQFLVIYREGSIRDTIGVWKRYSDFQELSKKVTKVHEGCASVIANMSPLAMTEDYDVEHLPNAITSWHLLKKRKRWYRCLDSGYLSLKAFLLERFLHDILFESSTPDLLRDFVGVPPPR